MQNTEEPIDPALIKSYFDRLLNIQSSIKELQAELSQLLRDADVDGVERQALQPLVNMLAGQTKPQGEKTLNTMIEYAIHAEIDLKLAPDPIYSVTESTPPPRQHQSESTSYFAPETKLIGNKMILVLQAITGLSAAGIFVWLLH